MNVAIILTAVLLPMMLAAAFLLGRHWHRRQYTRDELSAVSLQHIDLFQGGQLNESAVESAKTHFRDLLERGEVQAVEASLRPGTHFVVQVRALTELGTDDAGRILERQLHRRLTDDHIEQSWYWIDLANGLRSLNRSQSLPHLLRCASEASDLPLGHFFAAETVCFLGFVGYIRQPDSPLGRSALRVLHRAMEGLRTGVQPQMVAEARLGEMIETLWDHRPERIDPLLVRVFVETLKLLRRAPHAQAVLAGESSEQEAFNWQTSRLAALEPALSDYLQEAPAQLRTMLPESSGLDRRDVLQALIDLRADTGAVPLALLNRPQCPHAELVVELLGWSRDPRAGHWLRDWACRRIPLARRAQRRRRSSPPKRSSIPDDVPYRPILRAMAGHPSAQTEAFLMLASRDWDPTFRAAAVSSLGWWEPFHRREVLLALQQARRDTCLEVRQSARAALARLGERQALQWFRQFLTSEDTQRVHETIQLIAHEGLTLLWPDLDRLADADDPDIAHHARESLERLCEDMEVKRF